MWNENKNFYQPDQFKHYLREALKGPLPGRQAQTQMAPQLRTLQPPPGISPRPSAVLVPFLEERGEIQLLLTLRTANLHHHGGEISFPGGGVEQSDADFVAAAFREAEEEIALSPHDVTPLGELTDLYVAPSNHLIHPIVGWAHPSRPLRPNPMEVESILTLPLRYLLNRENIQHEQWSLHGKVYEVPYYPLNGFKLWGATAMILSEILVVIHSLREEVRG